MYARDECGKCKGVVFCIFMWLVIFVEIGRGGKRKVRGDIVDSNVGQQKCSKECLFLRCKKNMTVESMRWEANSQESR